MAAIHHLPHIEYGYLFQHTATRRWLQHSTVLFTRLSCFNTQPPEGGCRQIRRFSFRWKNGFNTQPPEGGCYRSIVVIFFAARFNTQPPEGGCDGIGELDIVAMWVSTHSHPKVAAQGLLHLPGDIIVSTHSHPKVAALPSLNNVPKILVSTHSHPKVAA